MKKFEKASLVNIGAVGLLLIGVRLNVCFSKKSKFSTIN